MFAARWWSCSYRLSSFLGINLPPLGYKPVDFISLGNTKIFDKFVRVSYDLLLKRNIKPNILL